AHGRNAAVEQSERAVRRRQPRDARRLRRIVARAAVLPLRVELVRVVTARAVLQHAGLQSAMERSQRIDALMAAGTRTGLERVARRRLLVRVVTRAAHAAVRIVRGEREIGKALAHGMTAQALL